MSIKYSPSIGYKVERFLLRIFLLINKDIYAHPDINMAGKNAHCLIENIVHEGWADSCKPPSGEVGLRLGVFGAAIVRWGV